jgi:hypothetical protein
VGFSATHIRSKVKFLAKSMNAIDSGGQLTTGAAADD